MRPGMGACAACLGLEVGCPPQVVVFDLEYGQPAASTSLPASRPAFRDFLGCYGHADIGKGLAESGVDLLYASHQVLHPCP